MIKSTTFFAPIFASLMMLLAVPVMAQDYLITTSRDTLYGEVSLLLPEETNEKVSIKTAEKNFTFNSYQVAILSIDNQIYRSIRNGNKYYIMKEMEPGYLGLYTFRFQESYDFGPEFLYKITGEGLEVPTFGFRNTMASFLEECDKIATALKSKKYPKSAMQKLVMDYNTSCLLEQKNIEKEVLLPPDELNDLIKDIQRKIQANETVPVYMIKALEEYSKATPTDEATNLLHQLRKD